MFVSFVSVRDRSRSIIPVLTTGNDIEMIWSSLLHARCSASLAPSVFKTIALSGPPVAQWNRDGKDPAKPGGVTSDASRTSTAGGLVADRRGDD